MYQFKDGFQISYIEHMVIFIILHIYYCVIYIIIIYSYGMTSCSRTETWRCFMRGVLPVSSGDKRGSS